MCGAIVTVLILIYDNDINETNSDDVIVHALYCQRCKKRQIWPILSKAYNAWIGTNNITSPTESSY